MLMVANLFISSLGFAYFVVVNLLYSSIKTKTPTLLHFFKSRSFTLTFSDSGVWDYFILYVYDYYLRIFFIYSLLYLSEYALIEKAS